MSKEPLQIRQLNVEIFGGCNYKCFMCPQTNGREASFLRKLPYDVYQKIILDALEYGPEAVSLHGSGEPTLHPDLVKMVKFASDRGLYASFFTHGAYLTDELFDRLADAGLDLAAVSVVGHDPERYLRWMGKDNFYLVLNNLMACRKVMRRRQDKTEFHTRHLVTDWANKDQEVEGYIKNWIEPLQCKAEIWMMHNWGGVFVNSLYGRADLAQIKQRCSCGRPFAPALEVRAGGLDKHNASVVPCPYVVGQDSKAGFGHLDTQTIAEILSGPQLEDLREAHRSGDFDRISYCRECDQLYNIPSALAWTNIEGRFYGQSKTSSVVYTDYSDPK